MVHVAREVPVRPAYLDGCEVSMISAFLFHRGSNADPVRLDSNRSVAFQGCVLLGKGFVFADPGGDELAGSLSDMRGLISRNARNGERVFPFIGGDEINSSPDHSHTRFVISFGQLSLEEAEMWPDLLQVVREKVKPSRDKLRSDTGPGKHGRKWWWQLLHPRVKLYKAIESQESVIAVARVGQHAAFARTGRQTPPSKPPVRPITTSAPSSWSRPALA